MGFLTCSHHRATSSIYKLLFYTIYIIVEGTTACSIFLSYNYSYNLKCTLKKFLSGQFFSQNFYKCCYLLLCFQIKHALFLFLFFNKISGVTFVYKKR